MALLSSAQSLPPWPQAFGISDIFKCSLQLSPVGFKGFVLSSISIGEVTAIIAADNEEIMSIKNYFQINHSFIYPFPGTTGYLQAPLSFWVHLEL